MTDGVSEPVWIPLATLHLLHDRQIELFGGPHGIRDEAAIENALPGPLNASADSQATDFEGLAAAHLCSLARQQGYLDGNKRAALAAMLVFLKLNGRTLTALGPELYALVIAATTKQIGVEQAAEWIRRHV